MIHGQTGGYETNTIIISCAARTSLERMMRSGCLVIVADLVRILYPAPDSPAPVNKILSDTVAVIARALASFLEYVGLIKPDAMTTDSAYNRRFYDQVGRYAFHTGVNRIVTTVRNPSNASLRAPY